MSLALAGTETKTKMPTKTKDNDSHSRRPSPDKSNLTKVVIPKRALQCCCGLAVGFFLPIEKRAEAALKGPSPVTTAVKLLLSGVGMGTWCGDVA